MYLFASFFHLRNARKGWTCARSSAVLSTTSPSTIATTPGDLLPTQKVRVFVILTAICGFFLFFPRRSARPYRKVVCGFRGRRVLASVRRNRRKRTAEKRAAIGRRNALLLRRSAPHLRHGTMSRTYSDVIHVVAQLHSKR